MNRTTHLPAREGQNLTTYAFKVVVEPDEDRWRAYVPELEHLGAATWGYTREEALTHMREVMEPRLWPFRRLGKASRRCRGGAWGGVFSPRPVALTGANPARARTAAGRRRGCRRRSAAVCGTKHRCRPLTGRGGRDECLCATRSCSR